MKKDKKSGKDVKPKKSVKRKDKKPTHVTLKVTAAGLRPGDTVLRKFRGKNSLLNKQDVEYLVKVVEHWKGEDSLSTQYLPEPEMIHCFIRYRDGAEDSRRWRGDLGVNTLIVVRRLNAPSE